MKAWQKGISIPRRGKAAPPCECGKPRRIRKRTEDRQDGYFYAHNCESCQRKYMLSYWKKRGARGGTRSNLAEKQALAKSLKTLKILHRALTGVELAR